ncbi:fatty acid-binding protein, adipocyte-like [Pelobates fuscus]|uniref:fatty acid-binding protein, adipocyte-like n=1 Tax=Pelobates fuscus TaxID=191477 RepID=UPI002FE49B54
MAEALLGKWKLEDANKEMFNAYMEGLGVGFVTRKAACAVSADVTISLEGDIWTIKTSSTFKNYEINFKIGVPFDEETADDRKVKTTVTLEKGVLIQVQNWDGKTTTIKREVIDGKLIVTCIIGDVVCVRTYKR